MTAVAALDAGLAVAVAAAAAGAAPDAAGAGAGAAGAAAVVAGAARSLTGFLSSGGCAGTGLESDAITRGVCGAEGGEGASSGRAGGYAQSDSGQRPRDEFRRPCLSLP